MKLSEQLKRDDESGDFAKALDGYSERAALLENAIAVGQSHLTDLLGPELERELRAAINPQYEDVRGTESYERKRLLSEIDRLRRVATRAHDMLLRGEDDDVILEMLQTAWRGPNIT